MHVRFFIVLKSCNVVKRNCNMKKSILVLVLLSVLVSCSSDGDSSATPPNTNGTLIRKIILTAGSTVYTGEYFYVGNKLAKVEGTSVTQTDPLSHEASLYTYTGNLITKIEGYRENVLFQTSNIYYDSNGDLSYVIMLVPSRNQGYKVTYEHNPDGTMEIRSYSGNLTTQTTESLHKKAFFENGLLSKTETYEMVDGQIETLTTAYTFDDKHEPRSAILGMNKLTFYDLGAYNTPNNVTAITYSATNGTHIDVDEVEYTYNSFGFPVTSSAIDPFDNGGENINTQFFYY